MFSSKCVEYHRGNCDFDAKIQIVNNTVTSEMIEHRFSPNDNSASDSDAAQSEVTKLGMKNNLQNTL